jgi:lipoyl(octanoyl) transferase
MTFSSLVARAALAACARASKRRRSTSQLLASATTPAPQSRDRGVLQSLDALVRDARSLATAAAEQPPSSHQKHVLRVVDLTTMRAAAESLRAFGGGRREHEAAAAESAERAASAASAAMASDPDAAAAVRELANDPSDPPLLIPYAAASALQEALAQERRRRLAASSASAAAAAAATPPPPPPPHTMLLLQHAPVFTVGKRGRGHGFRTDAHMRRALAAGAQLDAESPRGGQATFHGPGQAVVYPVVCLGGGGGGLPLGARRYVEALEDAASRASGCWGVHAQGRQPPGRTGVWAGGRKVAAVGVRVSRGVATHGLALNVASGPLLAWFRLIDPCGLGGSEEEREADGGEKDDGGDDDGITTSLWRELGSSDGPAPPPLPTVRRVAGDVAHALAGALGAQAAWPGQREDDDDRAAGLPPLPPEAALAVLEGLSCTTLAALRRCRAPL